MSNIKWVIVSVVVVCVIVACSLIGVSLKRLDSSEMGIVYDNVAKHLGEKVKHAGLHVGPVGYTFVTAPSVFKSIKSVVKCLNKDGIQIDVSIGYQYRLKADNYKNIIEQFKTAEEFIQILQSVGDESVHAVCADFNTTDIQTQRDKFTGTIRKEITDNFEMFKVEVSGVQISNYNRPEQFENAVEKKERVREDIQVAKKERNKKMVEAETKVKVALAEANITEQAARSYARSRTIEASNEAKTIAAEFDAEIATYTSIMSSLGLTAPGLLSYMGVRVLEKSSNPVNIAVDGPAKFSYAKP